MHLKCHTSVHLFPACSMSFSLTIGKICSFATVVYHRTLVIQTGLGPLKLVSVKDSFNHSG